MNLKLQCLHQFREAPRPSSSEGKEVIILGKAGTKHMAATTLEHGFGFQRAFLLSHRL